MGGGRIAGGRIALEHATLRAMAVFRYDNPGSVAVVNRPKTGHDLSLLAVRPEEADEKTDKTAKDKGKKVAGDSTVVVSRTDGDFATFREEPVPLSAKVHPRKSINQLLLAQRNLLHKCFSIIIMT